MPDIMDISKNLESYRNGTTTTTSLVITVLTVIAMWRIFEKAGLPGWWSLIPFYNIWLRFKLAGRSPRWILSLLFIPLFAIIMIVTYFDVAKRFGKSAWFGLDYGS